MKRNRENLYKVMNIKVVPKQSVNKNYSAPLLIKTISAYNLFDKKTCNPINSAIEIEGTNISSDLLNTEQNSLLNQETIFERTNSALNLFDLQSTSSMNQNNNSDKMNSSIKLFDTKPASPSGSNTGFSRTMSKANLFGKDLRDPLEKEIIIKRPVPIKYFDLAMIGNFKFIDQLFEHDKFDVNTKNPLKGLTLLHYAILYKNSDVIYKLLLKGADLQSKSHLFNEVACPWKLLATSLELELIKPQSTINFNSKNISIDKDETHLSGELQPFEGINSD